MSAKAAIILNQRFDHNIFAPSDLERLRGQVELPVPTIRPDQLDQAEDLLAEVELIFSTWGMPTLNEEFLCRTPRLRAVFYGAGSVKNNVTDAFWERGLTLCSSWKANAVPVSEYSLGAILLSLKSVWQYFRVTSQGTWKSDITVAGAYGGTVGLVSLGAIGRLVAQHLKGFSVNVLAHDPFLSAGQAKELGVESVALEELFRRSDVVSLHTPWLPETVGLINKPLLASMKPGATLINTSRGAVINEADLAQVFKKRTDLTALLDVTYPEPPAAESPLWTLNNVLMTPHIAGSIGPECQRMGAYMVDECLRFLAKEPLLHSVDREMLLRMA